MKSVKFLIDVNSYRAGSIHAFADDIADSLVALGRAKFHEIPVEATAPAEKKKSKKNPDDNGE